MGVRAGSGLRRRWRRARRAALAFGPALLLVAATLLSAGVIRVVESSSRVALAGARAPRVAGPDFDEVWLARDREFFRDRIAAIRRAQRRPRALEMLPAHESREAVIEAVIPGQVFESPELGGLAAPRRRGLAPLPADAARERVRPIPEPGTIVLLATGLLGLGGLGRLDSRCGARRGAAATSRSRSAPRRRRAPIRPGSRAASRGPHRRSRRGTRCGSCRPPSSSEGPRSSTE